MEGDLYTPAKKSSVLSSGEEMFLGSPPLYSVKEQLSGRYAQGMEARGFIALAIDPAFTE